MLSVTEDHSTSPSQKANLFTIIIVPGNAGVLHIRSGDVPTLVIDESSFVHNRAGGSGGVIHISSGNHVVITMNQSLFMNNQADEDGGVIYLKCNATYYWRKDRSLVNIDSKSNFTVNTAIRSGGIFTVYCKKCQLDIQTAQICCSNTANLGVIKACNSSDILMQEELFSRSDPTDMQCILYGSLYAITSSMTTPEPSQQPILCDNTSIHPRNTIILSFMILFLVLFLILTIILMCVTFYLCGVLKHKVETKSYVNDHRVYIPMNETEDTQN